MSEVETPTMWQVIIVIRFLKPSFSIALLLAGKQNPFPYNGIKIRGWKTEQNPKNSAYSFYFTSPRGELKFFFIMLFMIIKKGILDMFLILFAFVPVDFIAPKDIPSLTSLPACLPATRKKKNPNNGD